MRDRFGNTPFHKVGRSEKVGILLKYGADIETRNEFGYTPLHELVSENSSLSIVEEMLISGSNTESRTNLFGQTHLHLAVHLPESTAKRFWRPGPLAMVELLLKYGADIKALDNENNTLLHKASKWGQSTTILEFLINKGADLEARNAVHATPLHLAAQHSEIPEVIEILLEQGADGTVKDEQGNTPFDLAVSNKALKDTKAYWLLNDAQYP